MKYIHHSGSAILSCIALLTVSFLSFTNENFHHHKSFAQTDSLFTPNTVDGWSAESTYFNVVGDSVEFEIILFRDTSGVNWNNVSYVGDIPSIYVPQSQQEWLFQDPTRIWQLTLHANRKFYLKLIEGPLPQESPACVPIKTKYSK